MARGTAPTCQLQSAPTLLPPRSLPVPRGQPRIARRGLPRPGVPQAWLFPLPIHCISWMQMERCPHGGQPHTQLFLSALAPLMASTAQQDPTPVGTEPLPPYISSQLPWVLAVPDSGKLRLTKAGTRWLQSTPA